MASNFVKFSETRISICTVPNITKQMDKLFLYLRQADTTQLTLLPSPPPSLSPSPQQNVDLPDYCQNDTSL